MERQELTQYLKDVYELEHQLYTLKQVANMYQNTKKELDEDSKVLYFYEDFRDNGKGKSLGYVKGSSFQQYTRQKNKRMLTANELANKEYYTAAHQYVGDDIPYGEYYEAYKQITDKPTLKENGKKIYWALVIGIGAFLSLLGQFIIPLIVALVIGVILWFLPFFFGLVDPEAPNKVNKKYIPIYENIYNRELNEKAKWIQPIIESVTNEYNNSVLPLINETEKLLNTVYSKNIIHPKYRNFIAVAQIYEYFDTGRCDELGGANGAYNLFEQELRQNIIIDKLDKIIVQLEELNRTMSAICGAISYTNSLLNGISSTLSSINANTAYTAYNTQCIAYNTKIANQYYY